MSTSPTAEQIKKTAGALGASTAAFDLWWILIGAVGAFALGMTVFFVSWLLPLVRGLPSSFRRSLAIRLAGLSFIVATIAVLALTGATGEPDAVARELTRDVRPISAASLICAWPGLAAFVAVRTQARWCVLSQAGGASIVEAVRGLRSVNRRLLTTFGAFLTLIVIATGMRRRALLKFDSQLDVPAEQVLLYGVALALVLGLFYVSASVAIDAAAAQILDRFAPIPEPDEDDLVDRLARRRALAEVVGAEGAWKSFEATVLVAAPLLSALIGIATSP